MTLEGSESEVPETETVEETNEVTEITSETAATEITVPETTIPETETVIPETEETETAVTEMPTEITTEEAETEISVPETVLPETESEETEEPEEPEEPEETETIVPKTESESENDGFAVLVGDEEDAQAIENQEQEDIYTELPLGIKQSFETSQHWCITVPEGAGGNYSIYGVNFSSSYLHEKNGLLADRIWASCAAEIYHLEGGKTYYFSTEPVLEGATGILEKVDSWDMKSALERTRTKGYCVLTPSETSTYVFTYENASGENINCGFNIWDETENQIGNASVKLIAGKQYLLWFDTYEEPEEKNGRIKASQIPELKEIHLELPEGMKIEKGGVLNRDDMKATAIYEGNREVDIIYDVATDSFCDSLGNQFEVEIEKSYGPGSWSYYEFNSPLPAGNYTLRMKCGVLTAEVEFKVFAPYDIAAVNLKEIHLKLPEGMKIAEGGNLDRDDMKATAIYEGNQETDILYDEETDSFYDSRGNQFGVEFKLNCEEGSYSLGEFNRPLSAGNYTLSVRNGNLIASVDFEVFPFDDIAVDLKLDQPLPVNDRDSYFRFTVPKSGYYFLKTNQKDTIDIQLSGDDENKASYGCPLGCRTNDGWEDAHWLNENATYHVKIRKTGENQTLCLTSIEDSWDSDLPLNCLHNDGNVIRTFQVKEDGVYKFYSEKASINWVLADQESTLCIQEEPVEFMELTAGKIYLICTDAEQDDVLHMSKSTGECEHRYEWVTTKEPTCIEAGSRSEICKLCGDIRKTESIAAKGHIFETKVDKASTCGATGSEHKECMVCGYKEAATVIEATGKHNYVVKVDKVATCGATGSEHKECTVCGYKEAATAIEATGKHNYVVKVDKAATCGVAGSQHEECTVCGDKKAPATILATGAHNFGAYKTITAATVLKTGTKERICSVCGKKETASIAKLKATIKLSATKITVPLKKTVAGPTVTFGKGDGIKSWKSAKTSVVTVNSKTGKLTGKKAGTAKVTVTLKSGKKATITVTVKKIITTTKLKANRTAVTLKKGKSFQLKVTVTPKNSQEKVTYKSSNTKIATVTSKGKITAKKKGKAVITISSGTKKITCKVTVK